MSSARWKTLRTETVFLRLRLSCAWFNQARESIHFDWQKQCGARQATDRRDTRCKIFNCPALMVWPNEDLRKLFPEIYGPQRDDSKLP